jgi:hypothetical protein
VSLLAKRRALDYLFWGIPDAKRGGDGFQPSYSVHKYNKLVRTNKITLSKSKSLNVNNKRRRPNVDRSGSISSSLHAVPCLTSTSLQLNFSNL